MGRPDGGEDQHQAKAARALYVAGLVIAGALALKLLGWLPATMPLAALAAIYAALGVTVVAVRAVRRRDAIALAHLPVAALAVIAATLAATFVFYRPVLNAWFLADDFFFLTRFRHPGADGILGWWWPRGDSPVQLLRPISHMTTWALLQVFGANPWALHFTNIALHAAAAATLAWLALRATSRPLVGLVAGLGFALSPLAVPTVAWLNTHQDPLSALWFSIALALQLEAARGGRGWALAAAIAFAFALLCKEAPAGLPLATFVLAIAFDPRARRLSGAVRAVAPQALVLLAYIAYRFTVFGGPGGYVGKEGAAVLGLGQDSFTRLLLQVPEVLLRPANQAIVPGADALRAAAAAVTVLVVALLVRGGGDRRPVGLLAVGIACVIAGVAPVHNMAWLGPELLNARYLYIASAGMALACAGAFAGMTAGGDRRRIAAAALLAIAWCGIQLPMAVANREQWLHNASVTQGIAADLRAIDRTQHPVDAAVFSGFPPFYRGSYLFHLEYVPGFALGRPCPGVLEANATALTGSNIARYRWLGGERLWRRESSSGSRIREPSLD